MNYGYMDIIILSEISTTSPVRTQNVNFSRLVVEIPLQCKETVAGTFSSHYSA